MTTWYLAGEKGRWWRWTDLTGVLGVTINSPTYRRLL